MECSADDECSVGVWTYAKLCRAKMSWMTASCGVASADRCDRLVARDTCHELFGAVYCLPEQHALIGDGSYMTGVSVQSGRVEYRVDTRGQSCNATAA
jgi:hypothetical protein